MMEKRIKLAQFLRDLIDETERTTRGLGTSFVLMCDQANEIIQELETDQVHPITKEEWLALSSIVDSIDVGSIDVKLAESFLERTEKSEFVTAPVNTVEDLLQLMESEGRTFASITELKQLVKKVGNVKK